MKRLADSILRKKSYLWMTLLFFAISITLHWIFGWYSYKDDQAEKKQPVRVSEYTTEMLRDTMENWQSEFLQLMWQVGGLAVLFYAGSPGSREGSDRKEEKIDYILKKLDPGNYDRLQKYWDEKYPKQ